MSHNTWIHKISRLVIVRPLISLRLPVTPNQITSVRLATGLAAACAVALGDSPWGEWGAGLFVASVILDRADGDYARLSGQTSSNGHRYDLFADSLCNALLFVGLGWGLRDGDYGNWAAFIGLCAGVSVACILMLVVRIENREGERAAELGGIAGFDPDDAILVVPLAIWLGWSQPVLVAAAIGAPAFALLFLFVFRRRLINGQGRMAQRRQHQNVQAP